MVSRVVLVVSIVGVLLVLTSLVLLFPVLDEFEEECSDATDDDCHGTRNAILSVSAVCAVCGGVMMVVGQLSMLKEDGEGDT